MHSAMYFSVLYRGITTLTVRFTSDDDTSLISVLWRTGIIHDGKRITLNSRKRK